MDTLTSYSRLQNNNAIDCVKFIMAILVVAIHTTPFSFLHSEVVTTFFDVTTSLAVPFFFMTSGYFLYNKIVNSDLDVKLERIRRWWKKIARLYLVWTLIYLPFTIYGFCLDGVSPFKSFLVFVKNVLLVGQNYYSWPLWYLLAMLVAGGLIYLMEKLHFSYNKKLFFAISLTVLGYLLDYLHTDLALQGWWTPIVDGYFKLFNSTRNGFFQGLIFMLFGVGVAQIQPTILRIRIKIFLLISYLLCLIGVMVML